MSPVAKDAISSRGSPASDSGAPIEEGRPSRSSHAVVNISSGRLSPLPLLLDDGSHFRVEETVGQRDQKPLHEEKT